jgi:predicted RNA-binding protein
MGKEKERKEKKTLVPLPVAGQESITLVCWPSHAPMALSTFLKSGRRLVKNKTNSGRSLTLSTHHRHGRIRRTNVIAEPENNVMKEFCMLSVDTLRGFTYNYQVRPYFIL